MNRHRKSHRFALKVERCEPRRLLTLAIGTISQDGDFVGPDASVGPDGIADVHLLKSVSVHCFLDFGR